MLVNLGKAPSGKRLERIKSSPHFRNSKFENIHETPQLTEGSTMGGVLFEFFLNRIAGRKPIDLIPSVKTDLRTLPADQDVLVWFGHSSYYIQVSGKKILVDPVFSGNASPVPGSNKSFKGSDIYTVADLPDIDYLLLTHDHFDHLDYKTIIELRGRVGKIICGLGVGAHLEFWGYKEDLIIETDWDEKIELDSGIIIYTATSRHFSGRTFNRNTTLWQSYILQTPDLKIYLGGDSGYDTHFAEIGKKFGPFDLVLLDNGQYNKNWKYIHALPEEVLKAAEDLQARRLFPIHSGKFAMANHHWKEPLERISELSESSNIPLVTPMIGELVNLKDPHQKFTQWWTGIR
jgi:L-ascorbate metabolism protein UlaG (beta-lactamase superfamily)